MVFASFFVRLMGIRETADEFLAESCNAASLQTGGENLNQSDID